MTIQHCDIFIAHTIYKQKYSIPDLQLNEGILKFDSFRLEINTNGNVVFVEEFAVNVLVYEGGFADAFYERKDT